MTSTSALGFCLHLLLPHPLLPAPPASAQPQRDFHGSCDQLAASPAAALSPRTPPFDEDNSSKHSWQRVTSSCLSGPIDVQKDALLLRAIDRRRIRNRGVLRQRFYRPSWRPRTSVAPARVHHHKYGQFVNPKNRWKQPENSPPHPWTPPTIVQRTGHREGTLPILVDEK